MSAILHSGEPLAHGVNSESPAGEGEA